jgi:hypothetical protein
MAGWLKDWNSGAGSKVAETYMPYPSGYGGYTSNYPSGYGNFNTTPYNNGNGYGYGSSYAMPPQSYSMPPPSATIPAAYSMPMPQYQPQYQSRVISVPTTKSVRVPKYTTENITQTYTVPKMETKTRTVRVPIVKYEPLNPYPSIQNPDS